MKLKQTLKKIKDSFSLARYGPNGIRSIPDSKLDEGLIELKSRFDSTITFKNDWDIGMFSTTLEPTILRLGVDKTWQTNQIQ